MSASLENRLHGSVQTRFWTELFRNTGQFPLAILILEFLLEGPKYLRMPDMYILIPATLLQAYLLVRWEESGRPRRLIGNLIAPLVYTIGESLFEGLAFFQGVHHVGYWVFALAIGVMQATASAAANPWVADTLQILEDLVRAEILFFTYVVFEIRTNAAQTTNMGAFFSDPTHEYIALATFLLGLTIALANFTARRYLKIVQDTAETLRHYSEWLLGRDLLGRAITDPDSLALARRERTILFMDIRGFTHWSESRPPEAVVNLLDRYYALAEQALGAHRAIKWKFTADEVMAVFVRPEDAVQAALALQKHISPELELHRLGAGVGLHTGPVIEGLLGSAQVKFYDVIGDTANTASRIENAAAGGEILISTETYQALEPPPPVSETRQLALKGKREPITVYPLTIT